MKLRIAAGFLAAVLAIFGACESAAESGGILRLRVIANSDAQADQEIKLRVRDGVLSLLAAQPSFAAAEDALLRDGGALLNCAEDTLEANGAPYGAQLYYGTEYYPERVYAGGVYPAGEYQSLRVVLGDGAGQNWWCVLFPPLCLASLDETRPARGELHFESALLKFFRKRRKTA